MNDMLFHNNGNGVVHPDHHRSSRHRRGDSVVGAWGDYNRDGFLDLFVNSDRAERSLYRNNGDGTFRKMTMAEVGPIVQCIASDYVLWVDVDNDGWPELYRNAVPTNQPGLVMTNQVYHLDSQGDSSLMDIGEMRRGDRRLFGHHLGGL